MWKIFDHWGWLKKVSSKTNQTVLTFFIYLDISEALKNSVATQWEKKMFQALLGLFLSKALSPEMLPQGHIESIFGVRAWLESTGDMGKRTLEVTQWKI